MTGRTRPIHRVLQEAASVQASPDLPITLATLALAQARIVSDALHEDVVPRVPSVQRTFPNAIARRIGSGHIFDQRFVDDLRALAANLERQVEIGTHRGWQADEHHVRGGYETIHREDGIARLESAVADIETLAEAISATLCAVEAARIVDDLATG